jgi:hypothetical protein
MDCLLSLRYPNGRTHDVTLSTDMPVGPGHEFALFGRRWRAVGLVGARRDRSAESRMLCECVGMLEPTPV